VKVVLSSLSGGLSLGGRETRLVERQGELRVGGSDFPAHVQMLAVQLAGIQDRQEAEPRTTGARDVRPSALSKSSAVPATRAWLVPDVLFSNVSFNTAGTELWTGIDVTRNLPLDPTVSLMVIIHLPSSRAM
jgi:hypothetical protein